MTFAPYINEKNDEQASLQDKSWAKPMDIQWDIRFEQLEPPIEDNVMQVNTETKENPKPAFINESLTLLEKEDLVDPIRKYIDVFA